MHTYMQVRLINEANNKMSLREQAKRFIEEKELMQTCTFKPKINETSRCAMFVVSVCVHVCVCVYMYIYDVDMSA